MFKYRIKCANGCINDIKYTDSSSRIQKLKSNTLKIEALKAKPLNINTKHTLADKNATQHTLNRVRRAGASVPKKASL